MHLFFFGRKLLEATISNPVFSQAITKEGAPSCSGLTHAQTRGFTLVYILSFIDYIYRRGSYLSWIGMPQTVFGVQRNHHSHRHGPKSFAISWLERLAFLLRPVLPWQEEDLPGPIVFPLPDPNKQCQMQRSPLGVQQQLHRLPWFPHAAAAAPGSV